MSEFQGATRRLMAIEATIEVLIALMHEGWEAPGILRCVHGVPPDARFLWAFPDSARGSVYFVFEHESFAEVGLGQEIPRSYVTIDCHVTFQEVVPPAPSRPGLSRSDESAQSIGFGQTFKQGERP